MVFLLSYTCSFAAENREGVDVFNYLKPVVFQIKTAISETAPKSSYGTGFVVRKNGLLLTNFHVVAESILEPERYRVFLVDGNQTMLAEVLLVNPVNDLALIRVKRNFPLEMEISADMPAQGAPIYSIGMPEDLNMSIVNGTYNGILHEGPYSKIHMSSPINPGMSGGPTVDFRGKLIGVNVSKLIFASNISFSVPKDFASQLLNTWDAKPNKDSTTPPIAFEADIARQLQEAGSEIVKSLKAPDVATRKFGAWKIPGLPKEFHCWSDTLPPIKEKKFSITKET